jgi:hypothetical protein
MFDRQQMIRELEALLVDCGQESSPLSQRVAKFADRWIRRLQQAEMPNLDSVRRLNEEYTYLVGKKPLDMSGVPLDSGKGKVDSKS